MKDRLILVALKDGLTVIKEPDLIKSFRDNLNFDHMTDDELMTDILSCRGYSVIEDKSFEYPSIPKAVLEQLKQLKDLESVPEQKRNALSGYLNTEFKDFKNPDKKSK